MKYCFNCGTQLDDNAKFCRNCGIEQPGIAPQPQSQPQPQQQPQPQPLSQSMPEQTIEAAPEAGEVVLSTWENPTPKPQPQAQPQQPAVQQTGTPRSGYQAPQGIQPQRGHQQGQQGATPKKKKKGCGCIVAVIVVLAIIAAGIYFYLKYVK